MTKEEIANETLKSYELFHINIASHGERTVIDGRTVNIDKDSISLLPELIISIICKVKDLNRADILGDVSNSVNAKLDKMMSDLII